MKFPRSLLPAMAATMVFLAVATTPAAAHCDTRSGPVVQAAQRALDTKDVRPALVWVSADHEGEVRSAFQQTLAVRSLSPEAKELADTYFFETLVRIHREGEGAPYTGLRSDDDEIEPGIVMAEKSLHDGNAEGMVSLLSSALQRQLQGSFERVLAATKNAAMDVPHGREHVHAYVAYIHLVERIHRAIGGPEAPHASPASAHEH